MVITKTQPLVNVEDCQFPIIRLTKGFTAIVDAEDLPWLQVFCWRAIKSAGSWYACRQVVQQKHYHYIRMHREITQCPEGMEVHHINGNSLDNRRCNLVCVTPEEHKRIKNGLPPG